MSVRRSVAVSLAAALVAPVAMLTSSAAAPPTPAAEGITVKPWPGSVRPDKQAPVQSDPHNVLVKFKSRAGQAARNKALKSRGARVVEGIDGTAFVKVRASGRADELVARLRHDPAVAEISLDYRRKAMATPNDPGYAYGYQDYLKSVRMPAAWDLSRGSSTNVIAVVDTGVDGAQEDLSGRVLGGFNAITDTAIAAGARSDDNGHGTMVASVAAAATNNGIGIAGVAWNARVRPVKVLDSTGYGTDSDVAQGIIWAANIGAKTINLSLGGPTPNPVLDDALRYANSKGAVVVVAAGNDGDNTPQYPAAYPTALAVAATDSAARLTDFSSNGDWVDLAAPGWDITAAGNDGGYYGVDGTSFAAPIVAGVASLVRLRYPTYTPAQVVSRLKGTARDAGPRGIDPFYGAGFLDAAAALGASRAGEFALPALGAGEPNDTPARATALTTSATGTIGIEGDVDWYKYASATNQQPVTVTVTPPVWDAANPQNVDAVLSVYDQNLRLVGTADVHPAGDAEQLSLVLGSGTYYISVKNWSGARSTRAYSVSVAKASSPMFQPPYAVTMPTSSGTATAIDDVTGDGANDVVVTVNPAGPSLDNDIAVYPKMSLGDARYYQTIDRSVARHVAIARVDGDAARDVVVATDLGVQIFLQTAAGDLGAPALVPHTANTSFVVPADVDGDGDTDLVTLSPAGTSLLTRGADGTYSSQVLDATVGSEAEVGDVDGDGRPDVVVMAGDKVLVLHNSQQSWTTSTETLGGGTLGGIEVADVNGDGRADIAATDTGNAPGMFVLTQASDGTLASAPKIGTAANPLALEAADVNGDGRQDLVAVHGSGVVSVVAQQSDGSLGAPTTTSFSALSSTGPAGLAVGDVNGDGAVDAVAPMLDSLGVLVNATGVTKGTERLWVRSISPADVTSGLALTTKPTITFARPLNPTSVTTSTVQLLSGLNGAVVPSSVSYNATTNVATVTPTQVLTDNTPFRIRAKGVTDTDGGTLTAAYSSTFVTVNSNPLPVTGVTSRGNYLSASLAWKLPRITDLSQVIIRRSSSSTAPSSPTSGTAVYAGTGTSVTVKGLSSGVTYTYGIWVKDKTGKYSTRYAVRHRGTAATISSSKTTVAKGYAVSIRGKLTRKDNGAAIPYATVELWQRRSGSTTWSLVGTAKTTSTGALSKSVKPASTRYYRWIYRGSSAYMGVASTTRLITVT